MSRFAAPLTIVLESPFLSKGLSVAAWGVDASLATDGNGRPIIPGDLIKGNLRQALRDLAAAGVKDANDAALFGDLSENGPGGPNDPNRGRVRISDLVAETVPPTNKTLTRVRIDEATGAVAHGAMLVIELPYPIGTLVTFAGTIQLDAESEAKARAMFDLLRDAVALIPAIGACKSAGFGRVEKAGIGACQVCPSAARGGAGIPAGDRVALEFGFDRPILVDAWRAADNLFQGSDVCPGAVFKGALAVRLQRDGVAFDPDALAAVVFNHAFPLPAGSEEPPRTPLPFSVVADPSGGGKLFADALTRKEPALFSASGLAPIFQIDWKDDIRTAADSAPIARAGVSVNLDYDPRTHTAIDPATGAAAEGKIFTWAAVRADGLRWRMTVDRGGVDPARFNLFVKTIRDGLDGIGKTEASMTDVVLRAEGAPPIAPLNAGASDLWALTLTTPAVLNDVAALRKDPDMRRDYAAYWAEASDGALELVNFFAAQTLRGRYQAIRFDLGRGYYDPYVVTRAGSVFLLRGGEGARAWLATRARANLPLPACIRGAANWTTFPFMPENGFGAFVLNAVDHLALAKPLGGAAHV